MKEKVLSLLEKQKMVQRLSMTYFYARKRFWFFRPETFSFRNASGYGCVSAPAPHPIFYRLKAADPQLEN